MEGLIQFIYKNFNVQVIINLDANVIMAFCKGNDPSKFKTVKRSGQTIKTVAFNDLNSINFTVSAPIISNVENFSFDRADDNLSVSSIMKKICNKIDMQIG